MKKTMKRHPPLERRNKAKLKRKDEKINVVKK